jgi:hypothetical protein
MQSTTAVNTGYPVNLGLLAILVVIFGECEMILQHIVAILGRSGYRMLPSNVRLHLSRHSR